MLIKFPIRDFIFNGNAKFKGMDIVNYVILLSNIMLSGYVDCLTWYSDSNRCFNYRVLKRI